MYVSWFHSQGTEGVCIGSAIFLLGYHRNLFFGTATASSKDLTDNRKKEEGGLKQRRKQKEAAQGDPEPKKGNQEKEKNPSRVQS